MKGRSEGEEGHTIEFKDERISDSRIDNSPSRKIPSLVLVCFLKSVESHMMSFSANDKGDFRFVRVSTDFSGGSSDAG